MDDIFIVYKIGYITNIINNLKSNVMKRKEFIVLVMLPLWLFSCNQDNDLLENNFAELANYDVIAGKVTSESDDLGDENVIGVLKFTYKGETYVSDCVFGDGFQIKDETIKRIFDELNNIPNVAIEIKPNLSIEFYDSKEELDYAYELRRQYPLTRAEFEPDGSYIRNFELRLWDRAKGRKKGGTIYAFLFEWHTRKSISSSCKI